MIQMQKHILTSMYISASASYFTQGATSFDTCRSSGKHDQANKRGQDITELFNTLLKTGRLVVKHHLWRTFLVFLLSWLIASQLCFSSCSFVCLVLSIFFLQNLCNGTEVCLFMRETRSLLFTFIL